MKVRRMLLALTAAWLAAAAAQSGELLFESDLEQESAACWAQPPKSGCHGWIGIHGMLPSSERSRSGEQALKVSFEHNEDVGSATREIEARHVVVGFHDYYARGFDFAAGMKILRLSAFDAASQRNAFDIVLESRASAPDSNYCGLTDTAYLSIAYNGGAGRLGHRRRALRVPARALVCHPHRGAAEPARPVRRAAPGLGQWPETDRADRHEPGRRPAQPDQPHRLRWLVFQLGGRAQPLSGPSLARHALRRRRLHPPPLSYPSAGLRTAFGLARRACRAYATLW
jgi:hypothetical protein